MKIIETIKNILHHSNAKNGQINRQESEHDQENEHDGNSRQKAKHVIPRFPKLS